MRRLAESDRVTANLFDSLTGHPAADDPRPLLTAPDGAVMDWGTLRRESAQVANLFTELGLRPGDRVSVQVEKSAKVLPLYLGILRAGLIYHPLNTGYTLEEMRFFLADAGPGVLVCDPERRDSYTTVCSELGIDHLLTLDQQGQGSATECWREADDRFSTVPRAPDDLAALLYSSGTTGRPKGIMLSHGNLDANARTLVDIWGFSADDRLLHALPVYHVHGLFVALHCALLSGAELLWLPRFDVASVLDALPSATVMMGVPTYYTRLLADPRLSPSRCAGMRLFISGSAPLLESTFSAFAERTGHTILERYGMSETGMNTSNPLRGERRPGTVGFPLPGVDLRLVDDGGAPVAPGAVGEIEVRGANVFSGYWNMPEKTAQDIDSDGWFHTGDQGSIDADGYLHIVGRSKDMVISGGLNVYPKEVEQVLDTLPGVHESAVFGVPDADFGEAVVAVVVPEAGAALDPDQLRGLLGEHLARFKVPKTIRIVAALPRNAMGKVQKVQLRARWQTDGSGGGVAPGSDR